MRLVRAAQGFDLAKLAECLLIYEEVVENNSSIEQAMQRLTSWAESPGSPFGFASFCAVWPAPWSALLVLEPAPSIWWHLLASVV